MAEGDPIVKDVGDDGVPMIQGDADAEPVGPEDAAGSGDKRGDYADRGDGQQHSQYQLDGSQEAGDPPGTGTEVIDQNANMEDTPAVPPDGTKGGVDSDT
jgi:hypothetical protein